MSLRILFLLLLGAVLLPLPARAQSGRQTPQAREITVSNDTDRTLQELFLWRTGTPNQGEDRLGDNVLPARASLRVPLGRSTNCNWELRAVFEDGDEMRRRINVCRAPQAVLTDTGPRREVEVVNDSDLELRELYLTPPGSREEGSDRLGSATVPVGETYKLSLRGDAARECTWDVRAVFTDDTEDRRSRLDLCRTPRIAFGDPDLPAREVPVLNRGRRTLRELYAAPAAPSGPLPASRPWGPDRLGSAMIEPRGTFQMRVRSRDCAFDIRAIYEDDAEEVQRNIDLCVVQGVVFGDNLTADAQPRRVTLRNRHLRMIQQVFLSPTESRDWGDDMLGSGVLGVGGDATVEAVSGCRADLRVVFDTNAAEERREIDLCTTSTITLRPGWTVEPLQAAEAAPASTPPAATASPAAPSGAPASAPSVPSAPAAGSGATAAPAPAAGSGATAASGAGARAPSGPRRLRNAGTVPVIELYADPPGSPGHGPDRLGAAVLGVGESLVLAPPATLPASDRCHADLTAIFRDGRELRLPAHDLCSGEELVLQ